MKRQRVCAVAIVADLKLQTMFGLIMSFRISIKSIGALNLATISGNKDSLQKLADAITIAAKTGSAVINLENPEGDITIIRKN